MFPRSLFWSMFVVLGCFGARSSAQPLADRLPLLGTVVDDAGAPVSSAVVTVRRQEDSGPTSFWGGEARSDASGRFGFPLATEGRYLLNVQVGGHAPQWNVALDWKASAPPVRLVVPRLTRLLLRLFKPDATPLANAPVWVRLRSTGGENSPLRATTGAMGEVVVPDIAPGTFALFVVTSEGVGVVPSLPIAWKDGGTPFDVPLRAGATLKVVARDETGQKLGGATLVLFPRSPEEAAKLSGTVADAGENWALNVAANAPQGTVARDGDGVLELRPIPEGRFTARLSLPGYGDLTRDLDARNGQTIEWNADFPTRKAVSLSLQVRDAKGAPVASTLVALRMLPLSDNGTFAPASPFDTLNGGDLPFYISGPGGRIVTTDANGVAKLFPLKAGRYRVFASRPAPDAFLRAPVAPEGPSVDVIVAADGTSQASVQVP